MGCLWHPCCLFWSYWCWWLALVTKITENNILILMTVIKMGTSQHITQSYTILQLVLWSYLNTVTNAWSALLWVCSTQHHTVPCWNATHRAGRILIWRKSSLLCQVSQFNMLEWPRRQNMAYCAMIMACWNWKLYSTKLCLPLWGKAVFLLYVCTVHNRVLFHDWGSEALLQFKPPYVPCTMARSWTISYHESC